MDPTGRELDFDILKRAVERNSDGWGLATFVRSDPEDSKTETGALKINKGFGFASAKRAWKKYSNHRRVFHARIGTSGTKDINNCHPFPAGTEENPAWFFHNGTVGIPRFNEKYCDSYHLARYIATFGEDPELHAYIQAYAKKERSRFVYMRDAKMYRYGDGWLERDGFFYSNSSALADIRYQGTHVNARGFYEGGLLNAEHGEVTSDSFVSGFFKDEKRGLYTNIKPEGYVEPKPVATTTSNYPARDGAYAHGKTWNSKTRAYEWPQGSKVASDGTTKGSENGSPGVSPGGLHERYEPRPLANIGDTTDVGRGRHSSRRGDSRLFALADHKRDVNDDVSGWVDMLHAKWQHEIVEKMRRCVWMRNDAFVDGFQVSWPNARLHNFGDTNPGADSKYISHGRRRTLRIKGVNNDMWKETTFDKDGKQISTMVVGGPYPGGLHFTCGREQTHVTYNDIRMPWDQWREMVYNHYWPEIFGDDNEEIDAKSINRETVTIEKDDQGKDVIKVEGVNFDTCC